MLSVVLPNDSRKCVHARTEQTQWPGAASSYQEHLVPILSVIYAYPLQPDIHVVSDEVIVPLASSLVDYTEKFPVQRVTSNL